MAGFGYKNPIELPAIVGGVALIAFLALRSGSGGGGSAPIVVNPNAANDIISQNESANALAAGVTTTALNDATDYYKTLSNNQTTLRSAVASGASNVELQQLKSNSDEQLAAISADTNIINTRSNNGAALSLAQIQSGTTEYQSYVQANAAIKQSGNQLTEQTMQQQTQEQIAQITADGRTAAVQAAQPSVLSQIEIGRAHV